MKDEEIIDKAWKGMGIIPNQRFNICFSKKCLEIQRKEFLDLVKREYKLDPQGLYYKLIKELEEKK